MAHDESGRDDLIVRIARLNATERACLAQVHEGKVSKEIARELGLSPNYVDLCLKQAAGKLGVKGRQLAAKMLIDSAAWGSGVTVTSPPSNLTLQPAGLFSPPEPGDKGASAREGNGLADLGHGRHDETGSSDSRDEAALPKPSGPFAKFFAGENRLSKKQRLLLIFAGAIAIVFTYGGLVNIVLGVSKFLSSL